MILVVVFDGLRPDQINPKDTPALWDFIKGGVRFSNHHSIFPTLTRVNVASMFTGCYPRLHGVVGNSIYRPDLDVGWEISTGKEPDLVKLEEISGKPIITTPTLGEKLFNYGHTMTAIGVGSSGNVFLHHPKAASLDGSVVHPDFTIPRSVQADISERFGQWESASVPNNARIERAVTILLEYLLPYFEPTVATLWMSDPDSPQHKTGIGSPISVESIRLADTQFKRIINQITNLGIYEETDIFVVSDHGHSTVREVVDLNGFLIEKGMKESLSSSDVLIAENGGSALIYVPDNDHELMKRIAEQMMLEEWAGPIFTKEGDDCIPGSIKFSSIGYDHPSSPEMLLSFGWSDEPNEYGIPGMVFSCGDVAQGLGNHGSFSPFEIRNTMLAAGPSFKKGVDVDLPTSNADIYPTILQILGLSSGDVLEGRILDESLLGRVGLSSSDVRQEILEAEFLIKDVLYRQEIQISQSHKHLYFDKGSAFRKRK